MYMILPRYFPKFPGNNKQTSLKNSTPPTWLDLFMLQVTPFGSLPAVKVHLAPWGRRCVHPGWPQHHTTLPVPAHCRRRRGKQHPHPHHEHSLGEGGFVVALRFFFQKKWWMGNEKLHKYTSETLISFRMIGCILIALFLRDWTMHQEFLLQQKCHQKSHLAKKHANTFQITSISPQKGAISKGKESSNHCKFSWGHVSFGGRVNPHPKVKLQTTKPWAIKTSSSHWLKHQRWSIDHLRTTSWLCWSLASFTIHFQFPHAEVMILLEVQQLCL